MPRTISHVLGFMLALLLVGLSACVAAAEDPAVQLEQAYRKHSTEAASLDALTNTSCSNAAMIKVGSDFEG